MTEPIDQLLFGYRDGHELIAGSRELSPTQLREILPHLDASIEQAEQRQLVGAWIPSLDAYLLGAVWPAPERPRPGAVWGHALVLSAAQLRAEALSGLTGLLRRPTGEHFEDYRQRLSWPAPVALDPAPRPLARALVWVALDPAQRPGAVLWDDPGAAEAPLMALLDALPGGARAQLSFRTCARTRPGGYRVFVAAAVRGRAQQELDGHIVDARLPPPASPPGWTDLLNDDEDGARRREFLHRFGAEVVSCADVSALSALGDLLDAHAPPQSVVEALLASFPAPDQVPQLRAALLGQRGPLDGLWQLEEQQRLALLLEHPSEFDALGLELRERLETLSRCEPYAVLRLAEQVRASRRP